MTYSSLAMPGYNFRSNVRAAAPAVAIPDIAHIVIYIALACLLGLIYLVQVTAIDANGYKVAKYDEQKIVLSKAHDDLVLAAAQMQNLDRIDAAGQEMGMVAVTPQ